MHIAYKIDACPFVGYYISMEYHIDRERFHELIKQKGFAGPSAFSRAAGIHRNTILGYLNGTKSVFADALIRITDYLGVDPLNLIVSKSIEPAAENELKELKKIIAKIQNSNPDCCFMLLGSRASGKAKKFSDWDIGITGGSKPIQSSPYLKMKEELEAATDDFVRGVDLINLDQAPIWFYQGIDYQPAYLMGNLDIYNYFRGVLDGIKKSGQA